MVDVSIGSDGSILPPKNDKILLVDADTILFASAVSCEYREELLPRDNYCDDEWAIISQDPGFNEEEMCVFGIDMAGAVDHAKDKLTRIMDKTGCKDFQLHFTAGRESFRYTKVDIEYKANRLVDSQGKKTRGPYGLYQLKQEFCRMYPLKAKMWHECEADDVVWWLGDAYPERYIIAAVDKDILNATVAETFNYYERQAYRHPKSGNMIKAIDMKFQTVEDPELAWWYQCITGDDGDGIIGIKGMGPAKARKLLLGVISDVDKWDKIVAAYEKAGMTMIEALNNMRMVRLDQFNPETNVLSLWDPRDLV